jgi:hypothetical protein
VAAETQRVGEGVRARINALKIVAIAAGHVSPSFAPPPFFMLL